MEKNKDMEASLASLASSGYLPPAYWNHAVVKRSPGWVCPLSLYADTVRYSHTDSILGLWVVNLVTSLRHLVCVLRKRQACACGCRG
eukprot:14334751-Alexandrium_andersonii.AAC.1